MVANRKICRVALLAAALLSANWMGGLAHAQSNCWTYRVDVYGNGNYVLHGGRYPTYERAFGEAGVAAAIGSRVSHIVNVCTGQYIPFNGPSGPARPTQNYIRAIQDAYRRAVDARNQAINQTTSLTRSTFDRVNAQIRQFNTDLGTAQRQYPGYNFRVSTVQTLQAAVIYRSRSGGSYYLYGRYPDYNTAAGIYNSLVRQYGRSYNFYIIAQ